MDFTSLQPDQVTREILEHVLVDFAPYDPGRPWTGGELRSPVDGSHFAVPELAHAVLRWAGFVYQHWDEKTAWRVGGRFRETNVSFALTKFGLKAMVETTRELVAAKDQPFVPPPGVTASQRIDLSQDPELRELVTDFIAIVGKASQVFGSRVVSGLVDDQVDAGNVTLVNQNGRLRGGYQFFRWQGNAFIDGHGDVAVKQEMVDVAIRAAGGDPATSSYFLPLFVPVNIGYCLTAMASAYFSWLEHVLVLALPFAPHWDPKEKPITKIIGDSWSNKWRFIFRDTMGDDTSGAKKTFDLLIPAAEQFRNLDAHGGFGKRDQSLLVHTPVGPLPARLTKGAKTIKAAIISEAPSTFPDACDLFDQVDAFLRNGPISEAMLWIEGGLQVPFDADHRQRVRDAIRKGPAAFLAEVDRFATAEDRINNFEG